MVIAIVISERFKTYFTLAKNAKCSDADENNFFKEISDIVNDKIYAGNIRQVSFLIFMIILEIVVHFITNKMIELKEKEEREEKERLAKSKMDY